MAATEITTVEIFRTNVPNRKKGKLILKVLARTFPGYRANFDFEDRDIILRIEAESIAVWGVVQTVESFGFDCMPLD